MHMEAGKVTFQFMVLFWCNVWGIPWNPCTKASWLGIAVPRHPGQESKLSFYSSFLGYTGCLSVTDHYILDELFPDKQSMLMMGILTLISKNKLSLLPDSGHLPSFLPACPPQAQCPWVQWRLFSVELHDSFLRSTRDLPATTTAWGRGPELGWADPNKGNMVNANIPLQFYRQCAVVPLLPLRVLVDAARSVGS